LRPLAVRVAGEDRVDALASTPTRVRPSPPRAASDLSIAPSLPKRRSVATWLLRGPPVGGLPAPAADSILRSPSANDCPSASCSRRTASRPAPILIARPYRWMKPSASFWL